MRLPHPAPPLTQWARALSQQGGFAWLDGAAALADDAAADDDGGWSFMGCAPTEMRRADVTHEDPLAAFALPVEPDAETGAPADFPLGPAQVPRWIGYLAYDATWAVEPKLTPRHHREPDTPVLWLGRYDALVAIHHATDEAWVVADDADAGARLLAALDAPPPAKESIRISQAIVPDATRHQRAIEAALDHIAAGDIYQVNLARRWTAKYQGPPLPLFLAMREASPVPLGLFLDAGDHAVMARTMETFLRWDRPTGRLVTRPIKGTIARADGESEAAAAALVADDKERAEHAMIVDLMRNDLSRVAELGTVRVEAPFTVEPYAKLSHLVSTVSCTTRPGVELVDVLEATFPPGSVTGAPKIRAVEIIEALEPEPRGVYCGAVGHIDRAGGLHLAVAIRTALFARGAVDYFAGGGLVSASQPEREVAETVLKARVFLDALDSLRG